MKSHEMAQKKLFFLFCVSDFGMNYRGCESRGEYYPNLNEKSIKIIRINQYLPAPSVCSQSCSIMQKITLLLTLFQPGFLRVVKHQVERRGRVSDIPPLAKSPNIRTSGVILYKIKKPII